MCWTGRLLLNDHLRQVYEGAWAFGEYDLDQGKELIEQFIISLQTLTQ